MMTEGVVGVAQTGEQARLMGVGRASGGLIVGAYRPVVPRSTRATAAICAGPTRQQPPTAAAPSFTHRAAEAAENRGRPVHRRPTASQPSPLFG